MLPKKAAGFENETTNRRYLKGSDEEDYIEMCQYIREQKPKWATEGLRDLLGSENRRNKEGVAEEEACRCRCGSRQAADQLSQLFFS